MENIYDYTIKLIRYVLNGDMPELPENIDFEKLFAFGRSHGVENMLYVGLRDLKIAVPDDTMKKFKTAYEMQIMVEATQALELEALGEEFEKAGIDYVPLKGSVVKYLYPMPDYRKSGDIDILIRSRDENKIDMLMMEMGYELYGTHESHDMHFSYVKEPNVHVEVHRRLTRMDDRSYEFCINSWDYMNPSSSCDHLYIMNNEFLYVYLMAHLCKHLYLGGIGIRHILDIFILKKKVSLDKEHLNDYLKRANLVELNNMVSELICKWFDDFDTNNQCIIELENIIFRSGNFGTTEIRKLMVDNTSKVTKLKVLCGKIFRDKEEIQAHYPAMRDKNYPLALMRLYRLIYILMHRRNKISKDLCETFSNGKQEEALQKIAAAITDS